MNNNNIFRGRLKRAACFTGIIFSCSLFFCASSSWADGTLPASGKGLLPVEGSLPAEGSLLAEGSLSAEGSLPAEGSIRGLDCLLEPNKYIELSSPVQGVVESMYVQRGDTVSKGQLLVTLQSSMETAQLALAKARADFGQRTLNRNTDIQNILSGHEQDEIATDAQLALLELAEVKSRLAQKKLVSPIDGLVIDRRRSEGEYVSSEPVLTLVNIDPLYVEVIVPVDYFGRLKQGQVAQVSPEQPVGGKYQATIKTIDPVVDAGSGTFRVRLTLPNPQGKIPSGLRCQIVF